MKKTRAPTRGYRAGFLFAVALLSGVAGFTLWTEMRSGHQVEALVGQALERAGLIGRIRVDALSLESAMAMKRPSREKLGRTPHRSPCQTSLATNRVSPPSTGCR